MTRVMSVGQTKSPTMMAARIPTALLAGGNGQSNDDHQAGRTVASSNSSDESDNEPFDLSCICGSLDGNGQEVVQCDLCERWEHVACIFPTTKKVYTEKWFCHVCIPRPTELTPEQARAYQDGVKKANGNAKKRKSSGRRPSSQSASRKPRKSANSSHPNAVDMLEAQAPEATTDRTLRRSTRANAAQANEQPVEKNAAKRTERTPKKRDTALVDDSGEQLENEQPPEKRVKVEEEEEWMPDTPASPPAASFPPSIPPPTEDNTLHEELTKTNDMLEPIPVSQPPSTSDPPTEVDILREELATMKDKYERACQTARDAELRAEQAEHLLDTKPQAADWSGLDSELEKRTAGLTAKLEEARGEINKARGETNKARGEINKAIGEINNIHAKNQELNSNNDSLNAQMVKLRRKVELANRANENLTTKNTTIKKELDAARIAAQASRANELDLSQKNAALEAESNEKSVAAAAEIAALTKSRDRLIKTVDFEKEMNGMVKRENDLLKEEVAELKREVEKAKKN